MQTSIPAGVAIGIAIAVPILSALISAGIGAGAVLISQHMTNKREKDQRAYQLEMKEKDVEDAKQERLRDDRIKTYMEFARLTIARPTTDPSVTAELVAAYSAINLLGGSTDAMSAAKNLYTKALNLRDLAPNVEWDGTSTADITYQVANDAVARAYQEFLNAAREDIGHSPDVTLDLSRL